MNKRLIMLICIFLIFLAALAFSRCSPPKNGAVDAIIKEEKNRLEAKYKADTKKLQDEIAGKTAALAQSERRAAAYRERLAQTEEKLSAIRKPETVTETKRRLRGFGYEIR